MNAPSPPPQPPPLRPPPPPDTSRPVGPRSGIAFGSLVLSCVLFAVSLQLPALLFAEHAPVMGGNVLATGWMGLLAGQAGWYANPLYVTAVILTFRRRYRGGLWFSAAAVVVALHSLAASEYYFNEGQGTPIAGLGSAFHVWLAALGVLAAGNGLPCMQRRS